MQSHVYARFIVLRPSVVTITIRGFHSAELGDIWIAGDMYGYGYPGHTLALPAGVHTLRIRARAQQGQVPLSITVVPGPISTTQSPLVLSAPKVVPHIYQGVMVSSYLAIPLRNMGTSWVKNVHISAVSGAHASRFQRISPATTTTTTTTAPTQVDLAPAQVSEVALAITTVSRDTKLPCPTRIRVTISADGVADVSSGEIVLECRGREQSFIFTFSRL